MGRLFTSGSFSDIDLILVPANGIASQAIQLHKSVLSTRAEFFRSMFAGAAFREASESCVRLPLSQSTSVSAMRKILEFLYTAKLEITAEDVMELLAAADQLQCRG